MDGAQKGGWTGVALLIGKYFSTPLACGTPSNRILLREGFKKALRKEWMLVQKTSVQCCNQILETIDRKGCCCVHVLKSHTGYQSFGENFPQEHMSQKCLF